MRVAQSQWPTLDGWAASKGVDPLTLPFDRFLNLVYFWATEDAEEREKDKFDVKLYKPDERAIKTKKAATDARSPWTKENEEAALGGFVASLKG